MFTLELGKKFFVLIDKVASVLVSGDFENGTLNLKYITVDLINSKYLDSKMLFSRTMHRFHCFY